MCGHEDWKKEVLDADAQSYIRNQEN